jgi:hypothetical protein
MFNGEVSQMRILLDTNIILDSLLARMPFFEDADRLFQGIRSGQIIGYVTANLHKPARPHPRLEIGFLYKSCVCYR